MKYKQLIYLAVIIIIVGLLHTGLQAKTISYEIENPQADKELATEIEEIADNSLEVSTTEDVATPEIEEAVIEETAVEATSVKVASIPTVPFYSQFNDITPANWKKIACGIAALAMLIDYYGDAVSPDTLLQEGIASGAYIQSAGWSHAGLINISRKYGFTGSSQGLSHLSMTDAFIELERVLRDEGPVMVSVHYTFDPRNPIPHLVVVNGVKDGFVHYNDPAEGSGGGTVSIEQFKSAWKKRYIEIRPA